MRNMKLKWLLLSVLYCVCVCLGGGRAKMIFAFICKIMSNKLIKSSFCPTVFINAK